jgi:hypothetical protein
MTSACGQREPLKTASDFCLAAQRITAEPAPSAQVDDPGNRFDTDDTLFQVLEHNQVLDRLCPRFARTPLPTPPSAAQR